MIRYKLNKNVIISILLVSIRIIFYFFFDLIMLIDKELFFQIVEVAFMVFFISYFLFNKFLNKKKYFVSYLVCLFLSNLITLYYFDMKFYHHDIGLYFISLILMIELLVLLLLSYPIYFLNKLLLRKKVGKK